MEQSNIALNELAALRQGRMTAIEYNAKFKDCIHQAGIKEEVSKTKWYTDGLQYETMRTLMKQEHTPKTLAEWMSAAVQIENNEHRLELMRGSHKEDIDDRRDRGRFGRRRYHNKESNYHFTPKETSAVTVDPNAMVIDTILSKEERNHRMSKGLCFYCK